MKKIGIVTLGGNFNYGNRLQNYALERVIEILGFEVETIVIPENNKFFNKNILKNIKQLIKKIITLQFRGNQMRKAKEPIILPFTQKYMHNRKFYSGINEDFSFFIVGSDQVWNPNYIDKNSLYFLDFADRHKRISYAASFGVEEIPNEMQCFYSRMLSEMEVISVREEAGKKIVDFLTNKKATVLVDPTMLLSADEWNQLINEKKDLHVLKHKSYILLYFINTISKDNYIKIKKYAEIHSLEIIQVMGHHYDANYNVYDPIEFMEKIKNAHMVFTDSFHGCVFSIIFHTPFVIFDRSDGAMGSRIDTLLETFNLPKNKYTKDTVFHNLLDTDFSKVDMKLAEKRAESLSFLKNALQGEQ